MNTSRYNYQIKFTAGEFEGRLFAVKHSGIVIGKARSADIRPGGAVFHPEHISLTPCDSEGVVLHCYASAGVSVNGVPCVSGKDTILKIGDTVKMEDELTFVLERDSSPAPEPDAGMEHDLPEKEMEDDTEDDTEDATSDIEIVPETDSGADCTRYASAEELEDLRAFHSRQSRRKRTVITAGVILIISILLGGYLYRDYRQENPLTWPGTLLDAVNDQECRLEIGKMGKCMVYFPKTPMTVVKQDGNNCEVMTALGRDMDVPFHLSMTVRCLPYGFRKSRKESFQTWMKNAASKEGFSFLKKRKQQFYSQDHGGYPYYLIPYMRLVNNYRWRGFASYMRYQDKELILLREVPFQHYQRAENVLTSYNCFVVSPDMAESYWDITGERFEMESSAELLRLASRELRKNIEIAAWDDLDLMLRTLLCSASEQKDAKMIESAMKLWLEYRAKQQVWYAQSCLAYQTFQRDNDTEEMSRVFNACLRRFPSPDDYRHTRILKNIWAIEK